MTTRKEILDMLAAGQLTVDEAADLLNAIKHPPAAETADATAAAVPVEPERDPAADFAAEPEPDPASVPDFEPAAPAGSRPGSRRGGQRWLHIQVSDLASGTSRARVNVPVGLLRLGLKVGAHFSAEVNRDLLSDVIQMIDDQEITGTLVEVEAIESNEHVHIYID